MSRLPVVALLLALACSRDPELVVPFDPVSAEARMPAVMAALRTGRPDDALAALERLEAASALPEGAEHYRAIALADAGRLEDAVAAWERELERHPGNGRAHALLADVLLELGRLEDVPDHLLAARRHAPELSSTSLVAGRYALEREDDEQAQRAFRDYLLSDPHGPRAAEAHYALAQIASRRGPEAADEAAWHERRSEYLERVNAYLASYRQRVADDPEDIEAAFGIGVAYVDMYVQLGGDRALLDRAETALARVLELDAEHARATFNLGYVRTILGDFAGAESHYRRAIALDPDYAQALFNLARMIAERPEPAEARELYERVLAVSEDPALRGPSLVGLATLHEQRGEPEQALARLDAYLAEFPADPLGIRDRVDELRVEVARLKSEAGSDRGGDDS